MKKGPSPCLTCERQGCGAYHDICPDYQEYVHDEIVTKPPPYRDYIPDHIWHSRKKYKGR